MMKKKILAVLLALTTVISLGACGNSGTNETKTTGNTQEAAGELPTLRIALPTWVGYGPLKD